jgi:hypothetical protein
LAGLPKVSVLILNYNGQKWLPNCLSSVARTEYENLEVYLIDNNGQDNSVEYVKKNSPTVKIIQFSKTAGRVASTPTSHRCATESRPSSTCNASTWTLTIQ